MFVNQTSTILFKVSAFYGPFQIPPRDHNPEMPSEHGARR